MKQRLIITPIWVLGTFLLLSWFLYAANDYQRSMLAAITGQPGVQPTMERAKALETQKLKAKTMDEVSAISAKIGQELVRYGNAMSAQVSRDRMIQRAWVLWGVSAFAPLLFLWWSQLASFWTRLHGRPPSHGKTVEGPRI